MATRRHSTRLETRTKESITRASLEVSNPGGAANALLGIHAPAANFSIEKSLSESAFVSTRKMVNYACGERSQGKSWWREARSDTDVQIVRHT